VLIEALRREHRPGLAELFAACGTGCYCRFWHFAGDDNAWQLRCAERPHENRAELEREVDDGTLGGVVAVADGAIVGWLKLEPAERMTKMVARRLYRGLPHFAGHRHGVYMIGCLLVDPAWRRRGVARALIEGAVRVARERGAVAVEALPRPVPEPARDEALWLGAESTYRALGFREVAGAAGHLVLRVDL
jgi:GNAT superfamily N-acetyltransferase